MCGNCLYPVYPHVFFTLEAEITISVPGIQVARFGREGSVQDANLVFTISKKIIKSFPSLNSLFPYWCSFVSVPSYVLLRVLVCL